MAEVTMRELRNQGGKVIDRVEAGESFTVTRDGKPVAELRPIDRRRPTMAEILDRWRELDPVDPDAFRRDVDAVLDPSLFDRRP